METCHIRPSLRKIIEGCTEFQQAADELIDSGEFNDDFTSRLNAMVKDLRDMKLKCIDLAK